MTDIVVPDSQVTPELQYRIEQFLYYESRLLDDRQFRLWYDMLDDNLRYTMPIRQNRLRREQHLEYDGAAEAQFFDETKKSIDMRIRRLETGFAWAEDPPSRTRHLVTNVTIFHVCKENIQLSAYFHVYRSRLERQIEHFVGQRIDCLKITGDSYSLLAREIRLDQSTLMTNSLSFFF
ncbi:MAG: 3-phenylpropionate/cinnamic acid dioxygenase subunit beta [Gammaproteobacteria bacterium]|nr:3-phenylpropionate/cinnamic acid dioxygenase subunit beta [Gammaproteobacteria bacterium]